MEVQDTFSVAKNGLSLAPYFVGLVFILAGFFMLIFPPKKINGIYGYRTGQSMSNQEKWTFSQRYSAKVMMIVGTLFVLISALGDYFKPQPTLSSILAGVVIFGGIAILFFSTERAMKNKFDKQSN
ncbi:MAG TPA: SdpI family protein [Chitinophagales bacterium]